MRILVLGRSGQVGTALTQSLQGLGELIALDRAQLDLTNPDAIRTTLREIQPQIVINAAAYTAVDAAESDQAMAFQINAVAPRVMAEESERLGAALIHTQPIMCLTVASRAHGSRMMRLHRYPSMGIANWRASKRSPMSVALTSFFEPAVCTVYTGRISC